MSRTVDLQDDLSSGFHRVAGRLRAADNTSYRTFRARLTPRFGIVWRDIAAAYLGFAAVSLALWQIVPTSGWVSAALIAAGAAANGYLHHFLSLFLHEAAHYNLWPTRVANDRLANLFVGLPQCYAVESYRSRHFAHHRHLGQPEDPENYYFNALNWRLLVWLLSGVKTAGAVGRRLLPPGPATRQQPAGLAPARGRWVTGGGILIHGAIVVLAAWNGKLELAAAWTLGFLIVWPCFSTVREILEHRHLSASPHDDYLTVPHGAISRVFGTGPLASTFGAAGFNRHLLHHWDPQLSYTRLKDAERFLLETELAAIIQGRQTTYLRTLVSLWD